MLLSSEIATRVPFLQYNNQSRKFASIIQASTKVYDHSTFKICGKRSRIGTWQKNRYQKLWFVCHRFEFESGPVFLPLRSNFAPVSPKQIITAEAERIAFSTDFIQLAPTASSHLSSQT